MIITEYSPKVALLKQMWNSAGERTAELGEELKQRLVCDVLEPAVQKFDGQLVLKYHEFLTRVPSGRHSFAHGSEMVAKTVRWTSVARIAPGEVEEVPEDSTPSGIFATPSKVLVPVLWEIYLEPRYRRSTICPHFVVGKVDELNKGKFDISLLGHNLFLMRRTDLSFATKIEIAVGNESVGAWLKERKSAQTFNMLMRR